MGGRGRLGPMRRWREAATDALAIFAASRLLVLAVLLVPPTRVHSYLTTWDAGFYLEIARCGYDPTCGPPVSDFLPAFFPLQPLARARRRHAGPDGRLGRGGTRGARELRRSRPAAPPVQRHARAHDGPPGLHRPGVLPVLVRAQHELLRGSLPAGLHRGLHGRALAAPGARVPGGTRRRVLAAGCDPAGDRPRGRRLAGARAPPGVDRGRGRAPSSASRSSSPTSSAGATTGSPACTRSSSAGTARRASSMRPASCFATSATASRWATRRTCST